MSSKEIANYADVAMFKAEEQPQEPEVYLLNCNNDPLGSIAAAAKAYKGEFVSSLAEITDEERRYYLEQTQKSILAMPLESVNFHFRITGVTRGFTHQMVRQRTAAYSQESTRFAVKETVPVGRPPSLDGTMSEEAYWAEEERTAVGGWTRNHLKEYGEERAYVERNAGKEQQWRIDWDGAVDYIEDVYNRLVNSGMPAEDARGLLPTNLLTQLNYFTNLRNYKDEAGKRLCTQAQFEWRIVFAKMMQAIREYGVGQEYSATLTQHDVDQMTPGHHVGEVYTTLSSQWQFDALADLFRPVCYYRGRCQFMADFDRHCSIRDRVEDFAEHNIPSTEWDHPSEFDENRERVLPIFPTEWLLDSTAARKKAGE